MNIFELERKSVQSDTPTLAFGLLFGLAAIFTLLFILVDIDSAWRISTKIGTGTIVGGVVDLCLLTYATWGMFTKKK